jgi:hypothetical protein
MSKKHIEGYNRCNLPCGEEIENENVICGEEIENENVIRSVDALVHLFSNGFFFLPAIPVTMGHLSLSSTSQMLA